jgi:transcriptional regulator with XRE-family HTH domain
MAVSCPDETGAMSTASSFPSLCRRWRQQRNLSQLQLAEAADVSQRHVSWLETGRSTPSRSMVLRLAEALDVPLRERNTLLLAAGFAPQYRESGLDEPSMAPVRGALALLLSHHEPLPALVLDRHWNLVMGNNASKHLLSLVGHDPGGDDTAGTVNLARATLAPDGLRRFITNAEEALPLFIQRMRSEALASGDAATIAEVEALIRSAGDLPEAASAAPLLPVLPLELAIGGLRLSLFTVLSTFGTPQDVTTDELRVESFFPADEATRDYFEALASPR